MTIENNDNYSYFSGINIDNKKKFLDKLESFKTNPVNLIIKLNNELINNDSLILSLAKYNSFWKKSDKSFILVVDDYVVNNNILICVPSLEEAIDYLFMEELERNV
tara:strand:+ start:253 stop:570 length:318 start_codon:yes stop_codon:yes gene_type:complete